MIRRCGTPPPAAAPITYLDGRTGTLRHRGYAIEDLAEHSTYLEVAYLILEGELPSAGQLDQWRREIAAHSMIHEYVTRFIDGFRYDAPPMGTLVSTVAALSTFYFDAAQVGDPASAAARSCGSSGRCRRSLHSRTASGSACRTCIPISSFPTSATSSA